MRAGQTTFCSDFVFQSFVLFAKSYNNICNPANSTRVCDGIKKNVV